MKSDSPCVPSTMTQCDSSETYPLNKSRKSTDRIALVIFVIHMITYISTAVYAFANWRNRGTNNKIRHGYAFYLNRIYYLKWYILGAFGFLLLWTVFSLFLVRRKTRFMMKITIVVECIIIVFSFMKYKEIIDNFHNELLVITILGNLIMAYFMIFHLYIVYKLGIELMSEVIKESCRVLFKFFYGIIFLISIIILIAFTKNLTLFIITYLTAIDKPGSTSVYFTLFKIWIFYCDFWLMGFMYYFAQTVLYGTCGTWYWTMDKSSVPNNALSRNIKIVLRYHLGTVAYASSIWSYFVVIYTMIKCYRRKMYDSSPNLLIMIISWLNILWRLPGSSAGVTAIQGHGFKKSANAACQLYTRHPERHFAITMGQYACAYTLSGLATAVLLIVMIAYHMSFQYILDFILNLAFIHDSFVSAYYEYIKSTLAIILNAAVDPILFCILKDFEQNQQNSARTLYMEDKLKNLMID